MKTFVSAFIIIGMMVTPSLLEAQTEGPRAYLSPEEREQRINSQVDHLSERLNLTETQQDQVRTILRDQEKRRAELREKLGDARTAGERRALLREMRNETSDSTPNRIGQVLTDEQRSQYRQHMEETRQLRREQMEKHRTRIDQQPRIREGARERPATAGEGRPSGRGRPSHR